MRNNLRLLRASRDWSQADLADSVGVSRQTINALETRKYDPSLELAFKIARVFGRTIEEIFYPDDVGGPEAEDEMEAGRARRGGNRSDRQPDGTLTAQ